MSETRDERYQERVVDHPCGRCGKGEGAGAARLCAECVSAPTPGPWRIGKAGAIVSDCPPDCKGQEHEDFYGGHLVCESVSGADARLIVAAPDLLEAAKQAIKVWPDHMRGSTLEAAIAKAEGR